MQLDLFGDNSNLRGALQGTPAPRIEAAPTGTVETNAPEMTNDSHAFDGAANAMELLTDASDDWDSLAPSAGDDGRRVYQYVRRRLSTAVIGQDDVMRRLALIGTMHLIGAWGERVCLIGPSGSAKSTTARELSKALGLPFAVASVADLAENNWHGAQLSSVVEDLVRAARGSAYLAARGVICLDEIDKVATHGMRDGSSRDYRIGKQTSLLSILDRSGQDIRIKADLAGVTTWNSRRALIVAAGVFGPLSTKARVTRSDLRRYGLMPELVERLGHVLQLRHVSSALPSILRLNLHDAAAQFRVFGYELVVPSATLAYLGSRIQADASRAGTRSAIALLTSAAQRHLLALLDADAERGTQCVLSPDDLDLPL